MTPAPSGVPDKSRKRKEVNTMRNLDLPDQSWSVEDADTSETPDPTADAGNDDNDQSRSFHYGG
jgi:hypothetical protein